MTVQGFPRTAHLPIITTIAFALDSPPVSLNRTYGAQAIPSRKYPGKATARMFMRSDAEQRKAVIARAAQFALAQSDDWPRDLWAAAHVRISIYAFNTRGDAGNEAKLASDALEGVLYRNDRIVSFGEIPRPEKDFTKKPRVEFIVDLLEVLEPLDARKAEIDHLATKLQRLLSNGGAAEGRSVLNSESIAVRADLERAQREAAALIKTLTAR